MNGYVVLRPGMRASLSRAGWLAVAALMAVVSTVVVPPSPVRAGAPLAAVTEGGESELGAELAYYPFTAPSDPDSVTVKNKADGGPDATLRNGATWSSSSIWPTNTAQGSSVALDGVDDHVDAPITVATDQSFTVAAWARLDRVDRSAVVLSQDGGTVSGFRLRADANGRWTFGLPRGDSGDAAWDEAVGPVAVAGEWAHLAGVYDAVAGQVRLYVNGVRTAPVAHSAAWAAGGHLQIGRGRAAGAAADFLAGNVDEVHVWQRVVSDEDLADLVVLPAQARFDRCFVGHWLHAGGPEVKAVAGAALAGTDLDRRHAAEFGDVLNAARLRDDSAYAAAASAQQERYDAWETVLGPFEMWGSDEFGTFHDAPEYGEDLHKFLLERNDTAFHDYFDLPEPPKPAQAELDRALEVRASLPALLQLAITEGQVRSWSAYEIARFLRYGGPASVAPAPGSVEYRMEVESLKIQWADCDTKNPTDPLRVLGDVVRTAKQEWNAELAAVAAPRATIVAAETEAMRQVRAASAAMIEAQGQAWIAGQLLKWQRHWQSRPTSDPHYPSAADFARATQELTNAKDRVAAQLTAAQSAAAAAGTQADRVTAALAQAADIAAANGTPLYRGLAYARQSAQVVKASAAAAQSAADAVQTTLNAVRATNADAAALQALASTQTHALQAEFRRKAAQEAADQARATAEAAQAQAAQAAAAAARASADRAAAEQAEATARAAADQAAQRRETAERERDTAAAERAKADAERARAAEAEALAQQKRDAASAARADADAAAATAERLRADAEEAEREAVRARDEALTAESRRDVLAARAAAAEAAAAAAVGTDAAAGARQAADEAWADANEATEAAQAARAAANDATEAAVNAREAATRATAAAKRARAAAQAAEADFATAHAAAATAHAAAADAIQKAGLAAQHAKNAEALADTAKEEAATAAAEAVVARAEADLAMADSARTAGHAFAASQAALAARDAAAGAVAAATEAIAMGTPFQDGNASAGLAVLVGQSAKTLAEQQAAAGQARADEAARAAAAAQQAADAADDDARAAAQAAADAAGHAAAAAAAVEQARASAAHAAADAAAAQQADHNATQLAGQALADAVRARSAADDAESHAAAARDAATEAERDAASARSAATEAENEAAAARDSAAQADADADAAEAAAARAREAAEEAEDAATRAEQDQHEQTEADRAAETGPVGMANIIAEPINIEDELEGPFVCQLIDATHCTATINHHLTGQIAYFVRTCPDPSTTNCPGQYVDDYLGTVPLDAHITETRIFNPWEITAELWLNVARAMVHDFVECAHGNLARCALVAGELVLPAALGALARGIIALRVAIAARAFHTAADTAFFWSGRTAGVGGAAVARSIATARGGTTLEMLVEAKSITMPQYDPTNPASVQAWKNASLAYAQGARGTVRAVIGEDLRPGNIWEAVELPALRANPNVTRIIRIDPATGAETVIFTR